MTMHIVPTDLDTSEMNYARRVSILNKAREILTNGGTITYGYSKEQPTHRISSLQDFEALLQLSPE